jgi:hypothetical protein
MFTSMSKQEMKRIVLEILNTQGMDLSSVDSGELIAILDSHLELAFPDLRKFITSIEQAYDGKVLHPPSVENIEVFVKILMLIDENDWISIRDLIYQELSPDDIGNVYRFLNNNLKEIEKCSNNESNMRKAVITLAHYAAIHDTSAIPELNLSACLAKICDI